MCSSTIYIYSRPVSQPRLFRYLHAGCCLLAQHPPSSILHPPSFLLSFLNSLRRFSSRSNLDFTYHFILHFHRLRFDLCCSLGPAAMSSIGHHLVRRAFDVTQEHFSSPAGFQGINPADEPQGQDDARVKELALWAMAIIYITGILYMAMMSAVSISWSHMSFQPLRG